jgi:hypothetical protein
MSRGRAGFFKSQSQTDEAIELQEQARKAGLWGSIGSLLGSFALMPFLGPGASLAAKSIMSGVGSTLGNLALRKVSGADIDKGGLWHKGQKEQIAKGLNTQAITGGLTNMLTAGITPWLKGGMEGGFKGLVKGGVLDETTGEIANVGTGKFWDWNDKIKQARAGRLTEKLIEQGPKPITDVSTIMRDDANLYSGVGSNLDKLTMDPISGYEFAPVDVTQIPKGQDSLVTEQLNQITKIDPIAEQYDLDTRPPILDSYNRHGFYDLTPEEIMDLPPLDRESSAGCIYEPADSVNLPPTTDTTAVKDTIKKPPTDVDKVFNIWEEEENRGLY